MKSQLWKLFAPYGYLALTISMVSCTKINEVTPKPIISINTKNTAPLNENISGQIFGATTSQYNIAVYAKMNEIWYNIPNAQNPLITISEDASWVCEVDIVMRAATSEISVFLLPNGYSPPILQGESMIPIKMHLVATAKKSFILE